MPSMRPCHGFAHQPPESPQRDGKAFRPVQLVQTQLQVRLDDQEAAIVLAFELMEKLSDLAFPFAGGPHAWDKRRYRRGRHAPRP